MNKLHDILKDIRDERGDWRADLDALIEATRELDSEGRFFSAAPGVAGTDIAPPFGIATLAIVDEDQGGVIAFVSDQEYADILRGALTLDAALKGERFA